MLKNFAKTLDLKREFDVTVWRHKQCTPSNNDHHTRLYPWELSEIWSYPRTCLLL